MEFASVSSPEAAFIAGLVTSLHCAGHVRAACLLGNAGAAEQGDLSTPQRPTIWPA